MNPFKTSEIIINEGDIRQITDELMSAEAAAAALRVEWNKLKAAAKNLSDQTKRFNAATAEGQTQINESANIATKLKKEQDKYNQLLDESNTKIAALKNAQRTLNQVHKLEAKLATAKAGSYNALSAQYSLNKIRLNQMSKAERESTKEGKELERTTKDIYEEMKRLQEATGKHTLSVGDYGKALRDLPGPLSNIKDGLDDFGGAMSALIRNPFLGLIGLIAGALIGLFNAFKKSSAGAELLARIGGMLEGVFSVVISIANDLAEKLLWAFENPKEAVIELWNTIKTQVVEKVKGIIKLFGAVGRAIFSAFTFDFVGVSDALNDAGDALNDLFKDAVEYGKKIAEETKKAADAFGDLAVQQRQVTRANRNLAKSLEDLITKEQELVAIQEDDTRSFKERQEAADQATEAIKKRAAIEIKIAKNNLALINKELSLRQSSGQEVEELLDKQLSAYQDLKSAERELSLTILDEEEKRRRLKQDTLERDLDILLDGFDNQKTINEKLIANESLSAQKRRQILDETKKLSDDSFRKQIETIQQFTGIAVNANELIGESDAVLLNQKIRSLGLSEIIEGRLLEIVRDRKTANQDLLDSEKELNKSIRDEKLQNLVETQKAALVEFGLTKRTEEEKAAFVLNQRRQLLETVLALNEEFAGVERLQVTEYNSAVKSANAELVQAARETAQNIFDQRQELAQSEFDLLKTTEKQKTVFQLEAEKSRLEEILRLNELYGNELTDTQLRTVKNQIQKIKNELEKEANTLPSIYDLIGLSVSEEQKSAIQSAFDFAKQQVLNFLSTRKQLAEENVSIADRELDKAQEAYQVEIANRNAGFAHEVQTAEKRLVAARQAQEAALRDQQKAARQERAIQTLQQTTNLATAAAKIWKDLGFPLAIPAIGLMFGSFLAAKIKAGQLAKKQYGQGGTELLNYGGSHATGDDIPLGMTPDGKSRTAQRGERLAIFNRRAVRKYGSGLVDIIKSANNLVFEDRFRNQSNPISDLGGVTIQEAGMDDSRIVAELRGIRNDRKVITHADGSVTYLWGQNKKTVKYGV